MKPSGLYVRVAALVVFWTCASAPGWSQNLPPPAVLFTFDLTPTNPSEPNLGNDHHGIKFSFKDATGNPANLHSAAGLGLSGQATDFSFDNSASKSMGAPGPGGVAFTDIAPADLQHLTSFTITGWYKTANDAVIAGGSRFLESFGGTNAIILMGTDPAGTMVLGVNNVVAKSEPVYVTSGSWVFFAVTFDGTTPVNNVIFYMATPTTPVSAVSTKSLERRGDISFYPLFFANRPSRDRPFLGLLDDFRIFGSVTDTSGALSLDQVQAIYAADKPAPPSPPPATTGSPAAPAKPPGGT